MSLRNKVLISLMLLGFIAAVIARHPQLQIQSISISGLHFTAKTPFEIHSNQLTGRHCLSLLFDTQWTKHTATQFPAIKSLTLSLRSPSHLHIEVEEKKEWVSCLNGANSLLIAKDGSILNKDNPSAHVIALTELIIIHGIPDQAFQSKTLPRHWHQKLQKVVSRLSTYLPFENMQIIFNTPNTITLIKDDQLEIKLGSLSELDLKFKHLKHFIQAFPEQSQNSEYIDLRTTTKIVIQ